MYVDPSLIDTDSEGIETIKKSEFKLFFENIPVLVNVLKDAEGKTNAELMKNVISKSIEDTLNSKIIEGTLTSYIATNINVSMIVLPKEVTDMERPISTDSYDSEVKKIIGLYKVENFDIETLTKDYDDNEEQMKSIISMLKSLKDEDYDDLYESKIVYYSMSNYIVTHSDNFVSDMSVVIPVSKTDMLNNESISFVILIC